jgi:hypothetical protein
MDWAQFTSDMDTAMDTAYHNPIVDVVTIAFHAAQQAIIIADECLNALKEEKNTTLSIIEDENWQETPTVDNPVGQNYNAHMEKLYTFRSSSATVRTTVLTRELSTINQLHKMVRFDRRMLTKYLRKLGRQRDDNTAALVFRNPNANPNANPNPRVPPDLRTHVEALHQKILGRKNTSIAITNSINSVKREIELGH